MTETYPAGKKTGFFRRHARIKNDDLVMDKKTGNLVKMPSMARQEFRDQCDINNILKQFKKTGMVSHINAQREQGRFEELPDPMEYQDALNAVLVAQESFASLPSKIRSRFDNNPEHFLAFMQDPKNEREMVELGLATLPPQSSSPGSNQPGAPGAPSGPKADSRPPAPKKEPDGS